ncbi:unnamed protein product [Calicophoron daubneyi]|uniref:Colorectal mutant cancer protein n=1 Tax=Calicophoron daubneyi TaxID=300641 RepID=A0AAV2TPG4_CALDB
MVANLGSYTADDECTKSETTHPIVKARLTLIKLEHWWCKNNIRFAMNRNNNTRKELVDGNGSKDTRSTGTQRAEDERLYLSGPDNLTSIRKNDPADNSSNVYDLPEPDWITQCLENYELATSGHPSQDQLTSGYQSSRSDEKVDDDMLSLCLEDDSSIFTGPLSPQALSVFLSNLAKSAPYPRLVEVLHCTQLTWQRLVATLSRLRADCLVLQANLTEIKANADRMQCQLNQIEANWSAAMRSAQLADASLEISDCLNQLYATELAIILYRQTRKTLLGGGAFSTLSSSTSSSSFAGRARSAQFGTGHSVPGSFNATKQQCTAPSTCATPSSPGHPYAVYAVPGSVGTESDPSSVGVTTIPFNLRALRLFRNQAELAAHTLLDRYGSPEGTPDRFYPTVSSTGGGGQPQLSSGMFNRGAQNQAPISPGIFSIQSASGPGVPSTQSLSSASVYANSWYVSLGRIGRVTAANGTGPSEQASVGSGSLQLNSNKAHVLNLPAQPFGTTRISPKSTAMTNTFLSGMGHASGGGWQTPDSGAGSSGTNEVAQQPYLLGPFFQSPYQLLGFNPVANHGELNSYSAMLDLLPPLWSNSAHVNGNSICDSDSDSSDSSDAGAPVAASLAGLIKVSEPPQTGPLSQTHSFPLLWSRAEERKLRSLFYQLINARQVLRSTFPEQPTFGSYTDDEDLGETHQQSDLMRQGDFSLPQNAPSVASMGKLPLAVVLENSVLLQELCTIKEERAELKARVYLLEKELHSNRLTLESRTVAEKALRAHLDVLMSDNNYSRKTDDRDTSISVRTGQTETTLLRGQVKNLLQALEALRHSTELQQIQSEELVDDLRRANSALIAAYEKAKRKYLTRIKKLEDKLGVQKTCPDVNSPKHTDPRRAAHPLPPKTPEKLVSASPVRQINPSQSVRNQRLPPPPSPGAQQTQQSHISSSALPGALGGDRVVGLKPSSVHSPSPSRHCCRSAHPPGVGWPPSSTSSCVSNSRPTFVSQPSNRKNVLLSSSNQTTGGGPTATNHTRIGTTRAISPQHGP